MKPSSVALTIVKRSWILLIGVVVFLAPIFYLDQTRTDEYKASASVFILRQTDSTSTNLYQELLASLSLIKDYKVLLPSTAITRPVKQELADQFEWAQTISPEELANKISIKNDNDSHILTVSATDEDPERAAILANAITTYFKEFAKKITVDESVISISDATPPSSPESMSILFYAAGGLIGLVIGAIVALLPFGGRRSQRSQRTGYQSEA
ncbi:YveK family protein [Cohnella sp. AR92]|uniref:YveK family protein n=1 Tax=Cohnella sp. AR92 TaxID=648716 RepID=UPI001315AE0C|nr:hypothetical protein [Cohnella sp. AR92]